MKKPHVIVGLSGGVDSSVAALLLKQQGYAVEAVFMINWDSDDPHCSASQDLTDARAVCDKLDIPLSTVNFAQAYWDRVFQHFLDEYAAGRTPNPDILCNKEIKFKAFLDYALEKGADRIATGHYVRKKAQDGAAQLLKGIDPNKDQSYFLYTLGQAQLEKSLFPIGELEKPQVRAMAQQAGLITHHKKDSTGICFIGERRFKSFLSEYLLAQPGNIEAEDGRVIGQHDGLMFHTIGQRRGLNIGGIKPQVELPWYVIDKDIARNVLIVGQGHDHPRLLKNSCQLTQCHWVSGQAPTLPITVSAKTRYRQQAQSCTISALSPDQLQVNFDQPVWAITPGQSVVFYQDDCCLGGGVIV